MHTRRLTTLLLGLWLGASVLMDWIASDSFSTVEASFQSVREGNPEMVKSIGTEPVKALLHHQTAELNRHHFYIWGYAQSAFGIVLFIVVLFATNGNKPALILSTAMALLALGMQFAVMPAMLERDRALDFPVGDMARERAEFAGSHNTFIGLEMAKLLAGFGLGGVLLYRGSSESRRRRRIEINEINYAHNSRVNR